MSDGVSSGITQPLTSSRGVRLAVDAMGGDHGPREVVPGALDHAAAHPEDRVLLVGDPEVLAAIAAHPGRVFSREELLDAVWGRDVFVVDRTVDVHVRKIREKLGSAYIETVKGVGYRLAEALATA